MNLATLFITSILSENIILNKFLGICPFLGTSKKENDAVGMGISVTFVIVISSIITYLINTYILIPTNTTYLQTLTFILVIASFVQITELVIKKYFKPLYKSLGIYLPLIATNCAVLGVILINIRSSYTLIESIVYALGSSIGFVLVLYIFSNVRSYMETRPILKSFKGVPIALITAGIMALIFGRFIS
jgi:electron transport complex protein RnfA